MKLLDIVRKYLRCEDAEPEEPSRLWPPLSEVTAPMTDGNLQELAVFLARHDVHRGWLNDIYALDGFLACICIGPGPMPAEEWMTALFAHDFDAIDADEIDGRWPLIGRLYNMIALSLTVQPPAYRPLFETHPGLGQDDRRPLKAWCEGFMTATVLCDAQWERMLNQPETVMWLYPIWECASEDEEHPPVRRSAKSASRKNRARTPRLFDAAQLKSAVLKINGYWSRCGR